MFPGRDGLDEIRGPPWIGQPCRGMLRTFALYGRLLTNTTGEAVEVMIEESLGVPPHGYTW
jgi:hypothetical protein